MRRLYRQLMALDVINNIIRDAEKNINIEYSSEMSSIIMTVLGLAASRLTDFSSSLCRLNYTGGRGVANTFGRQALQMVWDFMESNPLNIVGANWDACINAAVSTINHEAVIKIQGSASQADATKHILPDDSAQCFMTDPPYYDAVAYGDLADYFYVWLKRSLSHIYPELFSGPLTPKKEQAVVLHPNSEPERSAFELKMTLAMSEGRRILQPSGIGIVVFAHKSTKGWETQLQSLVNAGWIVTGSWPIDTERGGRVNAQGTASLASSIHLVCRPREKPDGSARKDDIGDWRDILSELPGRIHEWMPRLAEEGVVGADAIFSCLGPALEIFSRYSSVEKASGEKVELREYLEQVWAAVAREALNMIFEGADASGFEEDARLTAMWLWTLRTNIANGDHDEDDGKTQTITGYTMEYDAARKIAQGLGAHLENLKNLIHIKGDTATLLSANSRVSYLFGKDTDEIPKGQKKKPDKQMVLFEETIKEIEERSGGLLGKLAGKPGTTVLDQLHQSMLLFGAGRGEALKRFLVEDGVGNNPMYWRLAQSFSALYPSGTDEKRWVDGVLARKKGLGF
jgi:putative DNA methylase